MHLAQRRSWNVATALLVALLGCLICSTKAGAVITIGSTLQQPPNVSVQGGASMLTATQSFLAPELWAPTPTRHFVTGTVVRWRIRTGDTDTGPVSFRLLRFVGGSYPDELYTGVGTSTSVTPPLNSVSTYDVNLPIKQGDLIGIDCCYPSFGQFFVDRPFPPGPVSEVRFWGDPPLADGDPGRSWDDQDNELEVAVNADVEPTNSFTVTALASTHAGRVIVTVKVPNDGTVVAGDPLDPVVRAAGASRKGKRKKRKPSPTALLNSSSARVPAGQQATLSLSPTRAARRRLHVAQKAKAKSKQRRKPVHASVKIVYTPDGGTASAQIIAVTLAPRRG